MVQIALAEKRTILTRDTHILKRKLITGGQVKALLINSDNVEEQIKPVVSELNLRISKEPFTICLECNALLVPRSKEEVEKQVPPYVWQTQKEYMQCPRCLRIYWKGTHWEAMTKRLIKLIDCL